MSINHESEKLNALLGKTVKLTFWNKKERTGVLRRSPYACYMIETVKGNHHFYKTHIKKIEVVQE